MQDTTATAQHSTTQHHSSPSPQHTTEDAGRVSGGSEGYTLTASAAPLCAWCGWDVDMCV
ncbi:hypothetical protein E2C01_090213 [Portunus trituberculatus]|uniref:Uncharacterized protein n=1 Tax=Portunus trituberculatus TaxID=210409 RepID=A0A5B7JAV6_PORTR|nr:hypothetical protein [Portunus trituberculatus]